jgi:hypothetical protein
MEEDYRNNPIAGDHRDRPTIARKRGLRVYSPGELVMIKRPKTSHFSTGAQGPFIVIEDLG